MSCEQIVGVKNILLTFTNCDTGQVIARRAHKLSSDELPRHRVVNHKAEPLTGGYTRRHEYSPRSEMKVIRDLAIPLAWYQGAASITYQVEYENGLVYTGEAATVTGEEMSDTHEVNLVLITKRISELLPDGALASAA